MGKIVGHWRIKVIRNRSILSGIKFNTTEMLEHRLIVSIVLPEEGCISSFSPLINKYMFRATLRVIISPQSRGFSS